MKRLQELCEAGGRYLAAGDNYEHSRLVLGAPMDYAVSFRPGSRGGPRPSVPPHRGWRDTAWLRQRFA